MKIVLNLVMDRRISVFDVETIDVCWILYCFGLPH